MIVTSLPNSKLLGKQIFLKFSYFVINSSLLCHFLLNRLAYKKETTVKSVFPEAFSSEVTSRSFSLLFLVSWFFTPPELKFDVFGTSKHGEEKSLSNCFSLFVSVSLWRFYRANYKSLSYTLYQFRPSSALWPLASALVSRSSCLGSSAVGDVLLCSWTRHLTITVRLNGYQQT